jgi:hypothetical protein
VRAGSDKASPPRHHRGAQSRTGELAIAGNGRRQNEKQVVMAEPSTDKAAVERDLARLTTERTELFARAGTDAGLSKDDQSRLSAIERELDACFLAVRTRRAAVDARRFTLEGPVGLRRATPQRDAPA